MTSLMKYKPRGRTGLQVSRLALGTMNFGELTDDTVNFKIVDPTSPSQKARDPSGARRLDMNPTLDSGESLRSCPFVKLMRIPWKRLPSIARQ